MENKATLSLQFPSGYEQKSDVPVIGLMFSSLAFSVAASCHSRFKVLGGGGAVLAQRRWEP